MKCCFHKRDYLRCKNPISEKQDRELGQQIIVCLVGYKSNLFECSAVRIHLYQHGSFLTDTSACFPMEALIE